MLPYLTANPSKIKFSTTQDVWKKKKSERT